MFYTAIIAVKGYNCMKYDGIIFDLDGTLWDSTEGICGTWAQVLSEYPDISETVTAEKLHSCFGLPLDEISRKLFPECSAGLQKELMDKCCDLENIWLAEHGGTLYPELREVLESLSEKCRLFIVSNCQCGYIESFFKAHDTARFFTDTECLGNTGLSKGENIRLVAERNGLKKAVYVGDTQGDADAAAEAGVPFVYASYGFGKVNGFDYILEKFSDIRDLFFQR